MISATLPITIWQFHWQAPRRGGFFDESDVHVETVVTFGELVVTTDEPAPAPLVVREVRSLSKRSAAAARDA